MVDSMSGIPVFPFAAIVGQEDAKLALLCNAVNPAIGGVLLSGDKGCGKSTMVRALADVLPEIDVVKGCPFNCNPNSELEMCDACREKAIRGEMEVVRRKMTVVDLPLSVSIDRLVGTIDVEKVLNEGIKALQPGILAKANRNILYIDEVNLLEDYVADVLLDSAAMGWNVVEREGISLKHPARFILVGSMNPEEGELRPQILDRFGLFVRVEAAKDVEQRMEILRRVEEFQSDPAGFREKYRREQEAIRRSVEEARKIVSRVEVDEDLIRFLVKTIIDLGIKTHRAEITAIRTAKAIAALDGRKKVSMEDLKKAMELSLPHRLKDKPFDSIPRDLQADGFDDSGSGSGTNGSTQNTQTRNARSPENVERENTDVKGDEETRNRKGESRERREGERERTNPENSERGRGNRQKNVELQAKNVKNVKNVEIGFEGERRVGLSGCRWEKTARIGGGKGLHVYSVPLFDNLTGVTGDLEVDVFGTLVSRAMGMRDVLVKVRKVRIPRLTAIVLDVSGSMLARRRVELAMSIARKLVEKGYTGREYISLLTFGGRGAELKVPPTRKHSEVLKALERVAVGGKTPLTSAMWKTKDLARVFHSRTGGVVRAILITDGRANVVESGVSIKDEIVRAMEALRKERVFVEVYDTRKFDFLPSFVETMQECGAVVRRAW